MLVDHVTIAGPDLRVLERTFQSAGFDSAYGGPHSNGVTHMALIPFPDGSYIELISTLVPGAESPLWHAQIAGGGGPCAWAVQVDDVVAEAVRVASAGSPVRGPIPMSRRQPTGMLIEWDVAFLGEHEPGAVLPFVIKDRTPRSLRVPALAGDEYGGTSTRPWGVAAVVLGVSDLEETSQRFGGLYGWPSPRHGIDPWLDASLRHFPDTPVVLASPQSGGSWLSRRLDQYGDCPCAFLLGVADPAAARSRFETLPPLQWFEETVAWINPAGLGGTRLGLVGRSLSFA